MTETPVTRLYDAMSRGDTAAMRACCAPDVRFWHCFDGVAQDIESSVQGWEGLIAHTKARHAEHSHARWAGAAIRVCDHDAHG